MHFQLPAGPVTQLAWVTDDLEATESMVSAAYGTAVWTRMPGIAFGTGVEFRGAPAAFTADISLGYAGDLQLELIQPRDGVSLYTEHLAEVGRSVHHSCVEVDDVDAAVAAARADGHEVPMLGDMGIMKFAYVDLRDSGFGWLELAQLTEDARTMYARMRAAEAAAH